jgi:hypothetical protein
MEKTTHKITFTPSRSSCEWQQTSIYFRMSTQEKIVAGDRSLSKRNIPDDDKHF